MDQISGRETKGPTEAGVREKDNSDLEQGSRDGFLIYLD